MTTYQTIDGVPRELLERALLDAQRVRFATDKQVIELRALLVAKPETVAGHHPACRAVDDYKTGDCSHSCKPAAQPQGEPVAIVDEGDDGLFIEFIYGENGNPLQRGNKLYAEQPALVAVVPKSECPNCLGDAMFGCDACNDEVTRLNAKSR